MPAALPSREHLESLLRHRKLDHTLTWASGAPPPSGWALPTGVADIDAQLDGGFPRGHLSEIVGPRSSGRFAVLVAMLAEATRRGEAVALIDPLDMFDPPSAAAAGLDLARVLWVRGEACSAGRMSLSCEHGMLQKSLDRAIKAFNLVLQAGGFGVVALDLSEIAPAAIKRLPYTTWLRLYRVIEGRETACVIAASEPVARSAAGATLRLERDGGGHVAARVIKARVLEREHHVRVSLSAAAC